MAPFNTVFLGPQLGVSSLHAKQDVDSLSRFCTAYVSSSTDARCKQKRLQIYSPLCVRTPLTKSGRKFHANGPATEKGRRTEPEAWYVEESSAGGTNTLPRATSELWSWTTKVDQILWGHGREGSRTSLSDSIARAETVDCECHVTSRGGRCRNLRWPSDVTVNSLFLTRLELVCISCIWNYELHRVMDCLEQTRQCWSPTWSNSVKLFFSIVLSHHNHDAYGSLYTSRWGTSSQCRSVWMCEEAATSHCRICWLVPLTTRCRPM